jgi:hypothetical protein
MHTLEELRAHLADVKSRMQEMDGEAVGRVFTSEEQSEFDALKEERSTTESTITHLEERTAYVDGDDIYDLTTIRSSFADPEAGLRELATARCGRSRRRRSPHEDVDEARAKAHVTRLLEARPRGDPRTRSPASSRGASS